MRVRLKCIWLINNTNRCKHEHLEDTYIHLQTGKI